MIAIDTNLLVYAHRSGLPEHRSARRVIERASQDPRGWGIPFPCLAEFWCVVTHPASAGGPSPPSKARAYLQALVRAGAGIWMPAEDFWERVLALGLQLDVRGPRIFDLQIALTALDHGASELWTHDRGFVSLPGLRLRHPL